MLMPLRNEQAISRFYAGETIYEEEQSGSVLYYIVKGSVELSITRGNHRVVIEDLNSGSYFGEMSVLLDVPRRTTAIASRYTEVIVIAQKELTKLLNQTPPPIRKLLLEKSQQLYQAINWAEKCEQNTDPLLAAAEIIELHASGGHSESLRSVILNYDKVLSSLVRLCGLVPCQAQLLIQSMQDFNLLSCSKEGPHKTIHIESFDLVKRTKKIINRVSQALGEQLRAETECMDLKHLTKFVNSEQKQILSLIVSGDIPDDILLFRKSAVLALIEAKGKDIFQKRKKKPINEWDCIADLYFANNKILQEILTEHSPYTIAVLLQALDKHTSERILALLSPRRRKILGDMAESICASDPLEIESIGEEILQSIKKGLKTKTRVIK